MCCFCYRQYFNDLQINFIYPVVDFLFELRAYSTSAQLFRMCSSVVLWYFNPSRSVFIDTLRSILESSGGFLLVRGYVMLIGMCGIKYRS